MENILKNYRYTRLIWPYPIAGVYREQKAIHLIECNCRFGGASTLSVMAGLIHSIGFFGISWWIWRLPFIPPKQRIRQWVPHIYTYMVLIFDLDDMLYDNPPMWRVDFCCWGISWKIRGIPAPNYYMNGGSARNTRGSIWCGFKRTRC